MRHLLAAIRAEIGALPGAIRTPPGTILTLSSVAIGAGVLAQNPAIAYVLALTVVAIGLIVLDLPRGGRALRVLICAALCAVGLVSQLLS